MIASAHESAKHGSASLPPPSMVKYSLPELLAEVELERSSGNLAFEKVAQNDISQLFKNQSKRRRVQSSS
jgi:hypothetical protein